MLATIVKCNALIRILCPRESTRDCLLAVCALTGHDEGGKVLLKLKTEVVIAILRLAGFRILIFVITSVYNGGVYNFFIIRLDGAKNLRVLASVGFSAIIFLQLCALVF